MDGEGMEIGWRLYVAMNKIIVIMLASFLDPHD